MPAGFSRSVLAATAHHEAGHAVQAFKEGIRVDAATIVPGDGAAGRITCTQRKLKADLQIPRQIAERHARVALAGWVAQRRHAPRSARNHHFAGDNQVVTDLALRVSGSTREAEARIKLWIIQVEDGLGGSLVERR